MLPYTVNSPRSFKGKSGKTRQTKTLLLFGFATLLLTGVGGLWYVKSKSAHVTGLLAVLTEHGEQPLQCFDILLSYCKIACIVAAAHHSVDCMTRIQTRVLQAAETKFDQLSAENEKLDNEVRRLNRAVSMHMTISCASFLTFEKHRRSILHC